MLQRHRVSNVTMEGLGTRCLSNPNGCRKTPLLPVGHTLSIWILEIKITEIKCYIFISFHVVGLYSILKTIFPFTNRQFNCLYLEVRLSYTNY